MVPFAASRMLPMEASPQATFENLPAEIIGNIFDFYLNNDGRPDWSSQYKLGLTSRTFYPHFLRTVQNQLNVLPLQQLNELAASSQTGNQALSRDLSTMFDLLENFQPRVEALQNSDDETAKKLASDYGETLISLAIRLTNNDLTRLNATNQGTVHEQVNQLGQHLNDVQQIPAGATPLGTMRVITNRLKRIYNAMSLEMEDRILRQSIGSLPNELSDMIFAFGNMQR
jgi:hypothetical protein